MHSINEDKLAKYSIDFSSKLSERYLKDFAYKVGQILRAMTTGRHAPVSVTGEADKVKAFAKAIGYEEKYISALQGSNMGSPNTMALRHQLESAIADFEKATGIKWPVR
tara:strand:+ start:3318 stop:3644 length:327 start_codon:yes stop_codon:yes gene_type:complete